MLNNNKHILYIMYFCPILSPGCCLNVLLSFSRKTLLFSPSLQEAAVATFQICKVCNVAKKPFIQEPNKQQTKQTTRTLFLHRQTRLNVL